MFLLALRNLTARPARSLLALSGLTVAILGMVGLYSVAGGIDHLISDTFGKIPGVVVIQSGAPLPLFSRIPLRWGDKVAGLPGVQGVNAEIWTRANLIEGTMVISPPRFLFGTDIDSRNKLKRGVYRDEIVEGRFLNKGDRGTWNTVISRAIAEEFHKKVGDTFRVNGQDLNVVGIYHCGSMLLDVAIVIDIDMARKQARLSPETVCSFYVEPKEGVTQEMLIKEIREKLRGEKWAPEQDATSLLTELIMNRMVPGASSLGQIGEQLAKPAAGEKRANGKKDSGEGFDVRGHEQWAEGLDKFSEDLDLFLLLMTSLGVTIAVLSILNTMLMSVSERFVEFGILKANGWSAMEIALLITLESALLGLAGGILGAVLGWVGTEFINTLWPTRLQLYASNSLLGFSVMFSVLLGIAGGLYPTIRAARLSPMDAIRNS